MSARDFLLEHSAEILNWINKKYPDINQSVLYSSIDIRESTFKIVPVDINLFPSGFNNFAHKIDLLHDRFSSYIQGKSKIGLLIENFTRNKNYLANIEVLKESLHAIELLTIDSESMKVIKFSLEGKKELVNVDEFDLIILNNDLNSGCPPQLLLMKDRVLPDPRLGWYRRRKNIHLELYNQIIDEMFNDLNLDADPWLFKTIITRCTNIDFRHKIGLETLAQAVDRVLIKIQEKYSQHSIVDCKPYVFIKANNGTFGMGIMIVESSDEILSINKRMRHSMSVLKNGVNNIDVVIQEGVATDLQFDDMPSENVLYSASNALIGKLVRYNPQKDMKSNLNSVGMEISISDRLDVVDTIISKLCNLTTYIETKLL
jgi:glutamate--cysteine ligase